MRIVLGIEYDGSAYHGWQSQEEVLTLQSVIEKALSQVANEAISITCAGRTDAGVHALGQVAHFDTDAERSEYSWIFGANSNLPSDISVRWAKEMHDSFHARFSAIARRYRYIIYNSPIRPSLYRHYMTWHPRLLDEKKMATAATYFIGEHDFSSFRGMDCQAKSPIREVLAITVQRKNHWIVVDVKANAFLHHMVRNIVGVLIAVGENKREPEWTKELLTTRDRTKAGITAPAHGLYLLEVDYPQQFQLPTAARTSTTYDFLHEFIMPFTLR